MYDTQDQSPKPLECDIPSSPWSSLTLDNFEYKGTLYLIIYDRFSCFIVVKTPRDLSARSTIMCLLEVFCEHGVPSFIHTDRDRNFVSRDFHEFCHDLGIHLNFSSGYHHSTNQAERAVHTVKDLMKCCYSASVLWRLALLEYLCTPGPSGKLPSELLYREFRGIMPMLSDSTNCISDANKFAERRKEEIEKFDASHQCELKPLIGSTVSFLNSDLKTWSMGKIHGRSDRSYEILTENGLVISRNRIHLCETNVVFREHALPKISTTDHINSAHRAESVMVPKSSPVSHNNPPTTSPSIKVIKGTIGSNDNCYRM